MDATVPFSYVAGFIINCGYPVTDVISFEVKWDRIIWTLKVKEGDVVRGERKVEQLIVREPPPVVGGSHMQLEINESVSVTTNLSTGENDD